MNKERLSVGLFCLEDIFNLQEAQSIVAEFKQELDELVRET